jgi:hypothetical protein
MLPASNPHLQLARLLLFLVSMVSPGVSHVKPGDALLLRMGK